MADTAGLSPHPGCPYTTSSYAASTWLKKPFWKGLGWALMFFQPPQFTDGFVFQPLNPGEAWSPTASSKAALGDVFGLGRFFLLLFCLKQAAQGREALFVIKGWLCSRDNPTHTFFPGQNQPSGRKWQQVFFSLLQTLQQELN